MPISFWKKKKNFFLFVRLLRVCMRSWPISFRSFSGQLTFSKRKFFKVCLLERYNLIMAMMLVIMIIISMGSHWWMHVTIFNCDTKPATFFFSPSSLFSMPHAFALAQIKSSASSNCISLCYITLSLKKKKLLNGLFFYWTIHIILFFIGCFHWRHVSCIWLWFMAEKNAMWTRWQERKQMDLDESKYSISEFKRSEFGLGKRWTKEWG